MNSISLVPISWVLLVDLLHPGDHDVTGGEHDAPHVAHHLPPREPQLLTLPLLQENLLSIYSCLTFNVTIFSDCVPYYRLNKDKDYHAILLISAVSGPSLVADNIRQRG